METWGDTFGDGFVCRQAAKIRLIGTPHPNACFESFVRGSPSWKTF
jgi:hypothetical protein